MKNKAVELSLNTIVEAVYLGTIEDKPHYGAPFFAVQSIIESLALVSVNMDTAAEVLSDMTSTIEDLEAYPYVIGSDEIEKLDLIIDECLFGVSNLIHVAADCVRYKNSFSLLRE